MAPPFSPKRLYRWHTRLALLSILSFVAISGILIWRGSSLLAILSVVQKAERMLVITEVEHELINDINLSHVEHHAGEPLLKGIRLDAFNQRMKQLLEAHHPELEALRIQYLVGIPSLYDRIHEFSTLSGDRNTHHDKLIVERGSWLSNQISEFQRKISEVIRVQTVYSRQIAVATTLSIIFLLLLVTFLGIIPLMKRTKNEVRWLEEAKKREQEARDEAIRANLSKTRFLANITHDLRSPLSVILGYVSVLKENVVDEETKQRYLDSLERNAKQMLGFVNELLEVSHNSFAPIKLNVSRVSLRELVNALHRDLSLIAEKNHSWLTIHGLESVAEFIQTDPVKLKRIFENLIGNAIKFSPEGRIDVCFKTDGEYFIADVSDSGQGIPPGRQKVIFEPFASFNTSSQPIGTGTGLGLAISREHARAMGGDLLLLSSQIGKGSTFRLRLPLKVKLPAESTAEKSFEASEPTLQA